jgi:hypothetical protein
MRITALMLIACTVMAGAPSFAQDGRRARYPAREECPQGRQIRAQRAYPSTMTDCQVLDADTAAENQKLRRRPGAVLVAQQPAKLPAPKPATPVAVAPATPAPAQAATTQPQTPSQPAVAASAPIHEDYEDRPVGNWLVSAKQDRFGDGGAFTAITGDGAIALAVRCLQKYLSIGIIELGGDPKPMGKGDVYKLKFRVDAQPIVDAQGLVINERLIQVLTEKSLVKSIREGKETALRLEDSRGVNSTHIFNTAGSRKAFADLSRECPLD